VSGPFIGFSCSLNMRLDRHERGAGRSAREAVWVEGTLECFAGEGWDQGHHKYERVCMDLQA
jgi:hypothetical protein